MEPVERFLHSIRHDTTVGRKLGFDGMEFEGNPITRIAIVNRSKVPADRCSISTDQPPRLERGLRPKSTQTFLEIKVNL